MNQETKLGLFILVGLVCMIVSIMLIGDYQFRANYKLNAMFENVSGLPSKAKVKIAGVEVGGVQDVKLEGDKAKVVLWIRSGVKIYRGSRAKIVATGLIGSKFLELSSGDPEGPLLKGGDFIVGDKPLSFDDIAQEAMTSLRQIVDSFAVPEGKNIGGNIAEAVENLKEVSASLKRSLVDQEDKLAELVDNMHSFSKDVADITSKNKDNISETLADIRSAAEKLDKILGMIEKGEGTIGKLTSDKQMGEDIQATFNDIKETSAEARRALRRINLIHTDWDFQMRSDSTYDVFRGDAGLRIWPRDDKFYYLGASNIGEKTVGVTDPEENTTFNLLLAKKFKPDSLVDWNWAPLTLYGGAIRSKAGAGVAVRPAWKWEPWRRLEITAEGYDFPRKTPVNKPKVNVGGRVDITNWLRAGVQMEDTYSQASVNSYVNLMFRDDDIAYILGLVGLAGN
ncbi:MAG: MlaD family protein [Elusimicrobiota bacterium]